MINSMFLQYREEGWFTDVWGKWYLSASSCSSNVGSNSRFDLKILSGLFYILSIGVVCSFLMVVVETLYVAYIDSLSGVAGFWRCLNKRLILKRRAIAEEWFARARYQGDDDVMKSGYEIQDNLITETPAP